MKSRLSPYTMGFATILLTLGAAGVWASWPHNVLRTRPAVAPQAKPPTLNLPLTAGNSASDKEIARWNAATQKEPNNDKSWVNLGDALMQKVRETADVAYYAQAERCYQQALAINPRNADATTGMAWVNGGRHEFEKSIEWANKAVALDGTNPDPYGIMGDADVEMGNYDAAFQHYQKMMDLRPNLASYSRGAHLIHLTGDTRKAIWLMGKAVAAGGPFAENTAWCRAQLGLMLFSQGAVWPAEQTVTQALKASPNNYQALWAMGQVKVARKDYPSAITYFKKAVAVVPQHDALVALGDMYRLTGKPDEAEKQYALVETIHKLQKANGVRGDIQIAQFDADHDRNLPEALTLAQEEVKTRPNVYVKDTLAWCYYKNQRYAEARQAIADAMKQRTPEARFLFHAGMIAAALHDRVSAQKYLYQALSLNPNFSPIYAQVASDTLQKLGSTPAEPVQVGAR